MIISAVVHGAWGLEIGGGTGALAGADSTVLGGFASDRSGASSTLVTSGSVPYAGVLRFVQDDTGKHAEISFDVAGASGIRYSTSFSPREDILEKLCQVCQQARL